MIPPLTIVVVNYNAGRHLRRCLDTARADAEASGIEWTSVVVDNASHDDSLGALDDWSPKLTVIRNADNRGFGAAVNQGARTTTTPLLWLLNPDCEVEPGAVAALWRSLAADSTCAIAAPQLVNDDGTVQESARGEPTMWTGLFGRHGLLRRLFPRAGLAQANLQASGIVASGVERAAVDWVMGAAMLIRRDAFDAVGGFDERYFLYWEDADLCRRLRDRGLTTTYVPGARVRHVGGASSGTARGLATRAFHRSAYRYYATHTVRSAWHPARWFAWTALTARAWWRVHVVRR